MTIHRLIPLWVLIVGLFFQACQNESDSPSTQVDLDADTDSDGDTDSDTDADTDSDGDTDSDTDPGTDSSSDSDTAIIVGTQVFDPLSVAQINISLDGADMDSLAVTREEYVIADVTFTTADGEVTELPESGVRLKGRWGSARTLDQKAAFLLNFDRFVPQQRLYGIEKLAVNNMVQDASMIHETVGYRLFREVGIPAPRTGYAEVRVNDELFGLYTLVESVDNEPFLKGWFGADSGNLYEGEYGVDLETDLISGFDQDNGVDETRQDLSALVSALDSITSEADIWPTLRQVIDMDSYVLFAATEIYLGHWDGYSWTRNNYFIYLRPSDGRWVFIPWGIDQTFADYLMPFDGDGRIQTLCLSSLKCRQALADAFRTVVATVETAELAQFAESLESVIHAAALTDPRKEYSSADVEYGILSTVDFLINRGNWILDNLVCEDPSALDGDSDGSSGCGEDCNDADPDVYPGAEELCNARDDNCDGEIDNNPLCPTCQSQPANGGGTLLYCFVDRSFDEAQADCEDRGGNLISIHDDARQDEATSAAMAIRFASWWIGLSDVAVEGSFAWLDGTPFDYQTWADGEPNNAGGDENCIHLSDWSGGQWNDIPCNVAMPYICFIP